MTPYERLTSGYYNSRPVSDLNPGGFGAGGHTLNFPAALADVGLVTTQAASDAQLVALAEGAAFEAENALRQVVSLTAQAIAAAQTAQGIAGFDPAAYAARFTADEARIAALESFRAGADADAIALALTL